MVTASVSEETASEETEVDTGASGNTENRITQLTRKHTGHLKLATEVLTP